ncbi:MAG: hypothetical protein LC792_21815, partial [Actinobacteria bacterium]|nr:hypothetical protein [Actinomycetota bacterium]
VGMDLARTTSPPPPRPGDDRPRAPGSDPFWADAWEIDFAGGDPSTGETLGGFVRLTLLPNQGVAWWWTSLLTPRLVAVRDHEVPLPRTGLEVRADGLWGELVCETPLEHWSIGLEAFGLAYDDLGDAWGDEWGERLAVGLDLEWEATGGDGDVPPAGPLPAAASDAVAFAQPGRVQGEILVGPAERIEFTGTGFRSRISGVLDWWSDGPHRRLAWVRPDGGAGGTIGPAAHAAAVVLGEVPILVTARDRQPIQVARALCRVDGPAPGTGGFGWAEWFPATGPELPAFLTDDAG